MAMLRSGVVCDWLADAGGWWIYGRIAGADRNLGRALNSLSRAPLPEVPHLRRDRTLSDLAAKGEAPAQRSADLLPAGLSAAIHADLEFRLRSALFPGRRPSPDRRYNESCLVSRHRWCRSLRSDTPP